MNFLRNSILARIGRFDGDVFLRAILLFLAGLICFQTSISAQYHFEEWTTDNGLPQNTVKTIWN